ncbi:serine threonine- kinase pim-2-like protein [Labeo rohita]|uniref:non-specific serine/threonine protein kinase n=1 Tax=Labeo rohita TaxID=84645 RepID=A0A498MA00_LABRO|nr:serine threonine- kinase pim-2-like protein [Labeo rohita]
MPELSVFTTMKTELPFSATMQANCYGCSTPVIGTPMVSLPPQRVQSAVSPIIPQQTPVQSVENPKGLGGVIIYDQETLFMDSHNLEKRKSKKWWQRLRSFFQAAKKHQSSSGQGEVEQQQQDDGEKMKVAWAARSSDDYIFSRYSVGDQLGKGAFGVVYEGRRLEDDFKVALKYVPKTDNMECIAIPDHPNPLPKEIALTILANKGRRVPEIIRLLDWTDHPDHFVIVLECPSPCENLVEFIRRHGGSLDEEKARQIMWQAVNAAHMCCLRGVLHRDVKLENLLINRETSEVKLIDFGCGDILRMSPYRSYQGTAEYSPPEYYRRGEYCGWPATVWSLGIVMFVMLCGHFPSDFDLHLLQHKRWSKPGLSKVASFQHIAEYRNEGLCRECAMHKAKVYKVNQSPRGHERILDLNCRSMISIQCTENPQGRDGIVLFDTEAFPMVSILCPISVEDLPDRSS